MLNHLKKLYAVTPASPFQSGGRATAEEARFLAAIIPLMPEILAWWQAREILHGTEPSSGVVAEWTADYDEHQAFLALQKKAAELMREK